MESVERTVVARGSGGEREGRTGKAQMIFMVVKILCATVTWIYDIMHLLKSVERYNTKSEP